MTRLSGRSLFGALLGTTLLAVSALNGQTNSTWNFGTTAPGNANPIVTGNDLLVSALSQGNNNGTTALLTTTSASSGYTEASGSYNAGAAARTGVLNTGASGSAYFEFTMTPENGATIILTEISFGSRSTGTGPQAYSMRSDADGYATDFATDSLPNNSTWTLKTFGSLSFAFSSPRTFRIFGHNGTGSASANTANWRIDDLSVTTGEPASGPTITVNPSLPAFSTVSGTASASQSFSVTGAELTEAIDLVATTGFEVSSDNVSFGSSASLPLAGGTGYARVAASAAVGSVTGSITLSSTGATNRTVGLTGTVSDPNVLTLTLLPTSIPEDSASPAVGTISIPVARPEDLEITLVSANTAAATVPATATITAGQTSTTFDATPVPAPSSFLTNSSLITASADGLANGSATLQVTNVDVPPIVSVSLTASPYVQDFDSLGNVAFPSVVSSTVGAQTSLGAFAGAPLNGWYVTKIAGTGTTATSISPDNGTTGSGLVNNYGATGNSDRALGLLASGTNTMAMGALITNNTGESLTGLSLSMTAEFWRSSTSTQNTLTFGYGKIAGDITSANFLSVENAGVLPLTGLDIVGPAPVTTSGMLNENDPANQSVFTNVSLPLVLAPGESAFIRWQDDNDTGNDAGLAIDNLTITGGTSGTSGYLAWINGFFENETNPNIIGFNADPDFDGISNGVEALIGGNPNAPGAFATTGLTKDGSTFSFLYPQSKTVPLGVTPSYEWSTDLANWQGSGGSFGGVTVTLADVLSNGTDPQVNIYQVTATVTAGTATKIFVRVVANNN